MLEPSARNSNLLPVNANGLVRLRSPECCGSVGITGVPRPRNGPGLERSALPSAIASQIRSSCGPRKIEMIAGGASFAPSRWSWPGLAIDARSSAWWVSTAATTAARRTGREVLRRRVARLEQVRPVSVPIDQLLCLPEPLTPAKGFSCSSRQGRSAGDVLQHLHRQHLVVAADVRPLEDRRDLVLVRRDLVVTRLHGHAELESSCSDSSM